MTIATDTSVTITNKSTAYLCYASFLVDSSNFTFTRSGENIDLRDYWQKDYNQDTEITDKAFWANIQKPKSYDLVPNG